MLIPLLVPLFLPQEPPVPANVIVVLLDDIGRDKIGAYGDHPSPAPTPNLDAFAQKGVLFRRAWSYPICSPTRAAVMTGRFSDRTGIGTIINAFDGVQTPLPDAEITLAEALPDHRSFMLGKWHLQDTMTPLTHPLSQGFAAYVGYRGAPTYFQWETQINGLTRPERGYFPTMLTRRGKNLLERVGEPFFLYHCPILAHSPFHVPPQSLHNQGVPSFEPFLHVAMVEAFDTLFGELMESVDLSDTFVFVLSDNGSPGGSIRSPWPMGRGKRTPYEGGVRVPFLVAGPGVARGQECEELIHVTDIYSTILELVGQVPSGMGAEDSVSFAPLLADPSLPGVRDTLYFHQFPFPGATTNVQEFRAIRTKRWKLIERTDTSTYELYDLNIDVHETQNLLLTQPGAATAALRDRLLAAMPTFP